MISPAIFPLPLCFASLCASVSAPHAHFILRIFTTRLCVVLHFFVLISSTSVVDSKRLANSPLTTRSHHILCLFVSVYRFRVDALRTLPLLLDYAHFVLHNFALFQSRSFSYSCPMSILPTSPSVWSVRLVKPDLAHLFNNFFFLFASAGLSYKQNVAFRSRTQPIQYL